MKTRTYFWIISIWDTRGSLVFNKIYAETSEYDTSALEHHSKEFLHFPWHYQYHIELAHKEPDLSFYVIEDAWPGMLDALPAVLPTLSLMY